MGARACGQPVTDSAPSSERLGACGRGTTTCTSPPPEPAAAGDAPIAVVLPLITRSESDPDVSLAELLADTFAEELAPGDAALPCMSMVELFPLVASCELA